ncbi:MAG: ABC transporter permease subunit [Euryarchaeota archaeon]|nr:ABC transporter permease subunit [Euryarchaeota archaeon]
MAERTIVLAVIIQVFVAGFSSILVAGLAVLSDPSSVSFDSGARVAVTGSSEVAAALRDARLAVEEYPSVTEAFAAFQRGSVDAALMVGPSTNASEPVTMRLIVPDGELRGTLVVSLLKAPLQRFERDLREERVDRLVDDPLYFDAKETSGPYEFVYSLLVPLLVLLPALLAGSLVADSLTEETQRKTLQILLSSGATLVDVAAGKVLATAAIAPALAATSLILLGLNGFPVSGGDVVTIMLVTTAAAVVFCVLAAMVALTLRDRNQTQTIYAGLLMLLIVSSLRLSPTPVNAIARLASGSADASTVGFVAGAVLTAVLACFALAVVLKILGGVKDESA